MTLQKMSLRFMYSNFISSFRFCMKRRALLLVALMLAFGVSVGSGQIRKAKTEAELRNGGGSTVKILDNRMSAQELDVWLKKRTSSQFLGSFESYSSMLWAVNEVGIWCESTNAAAVQLRSPYPETYRPTWKEKMEVLARQVGCTWRYNLETGYWMFEEKKVPPAFKLKVADGWTRRDSGESTVFVPPTAPVGMDVYYMGHYSSDKPSDLPELYTNARKHVSKLFAERFKEDVSDKDFSSEKVCGAEATFFSVPTPRDPKLKWRQWAFVKNGTCFVVVSVISDENEARLLKDVKGMLSTFEVAE